MEINLLATISAILFVLIYWGLWKWRRRFATPRLLYSPIEGFNPKKSLKQYFSGVPNALKYATLLFFLLAWIDPHTFSELPLENIPPVNPGKGIAIYLILDESGSMMENITMELADRSRKTGSKIDLLKTVTEPFIKKRNNDLIGLVSFGRTAQIQSPLTLDHQDVINKMLQLKPSISEEEGGTAIGYAIYKTAHLIVATKHFAQDLIKKGNSAYEIRNSVIVLVTDGVQNVNPLDEGNTLRSMDIAEATAYAKRNDIKLYIINVDPSILSETLGPQRRLMQRSAESTGGKFYAVDGAHNLDSIYTDIDTIEKSQLPPQIISKESQPERYQRHSFYPYLIAAGIACLLAAIFLGTTLLRKIP